MTSCCTMFIAWPPFDHFALENAKQDICLGDFKKHTLNERWQGRCTKAEKVAIASEATTIVGQAWDSCTHKRSEEPPFSPWSLSPASHLLYLLFPWHWRLKKSRTSSPKMVLNLTSPNLGKTCFETMEIHPSTSQTAVGRNAKGIVNQLEAHYKPGSFQMHWKHCEPKRDPKFFWIS